VLKASALEAQTPSVGLPVRADLTNGGHDRFRVGRTAVTEALSCVNNPLRESGRSRGATRKLLAGASRCARRPRIAASLEVREGSRVSKVLTNRVDTEDLTG
jgi:hypothetical protein